MSQISRTNIFSQLGWSFYLACSWTWCIGMFLPVILQKDFGSGSWLLFTLCNVAGATGFAYVIKSRQQSLQFIERHSRACQLFSWVTLLFQAFFIGWVATRISFSASIVGLLVFALATLTFKKQRDMRIFSVLVWLLSATAFVIYLQTPAGQKLPQLLLSELSNLELLQGYPLAILAFGFFLCPYLDLSFHQAISSQGSKVSKQRFLLAFPVLFFCMLLFTLSYRESIAGYLLFPESNEQAGFVIKLLFCYLLMQAGFTLLVHCQRLHSVSKTNRSAPYIGAAMFMVVPSLIGSIQLPINMTVNELIYRCFMSYYGIIAPAYIWLFARHKQPLVNFKLGLFIIALSLACITVPLLMQSDQYNIMYLLAVLGVVVAGLLPVRALSKA